MANEEDEWAEEAAEDEADRQRKAEPPPLLDHDEFLSWRSPRLVTESPTRLDNPLWHWLVRTRHSAYSANQALDGPSSFAAGPMWCFDRFGMTTTTLVDARNVHVGGEHEDYYDPDFHIYNDTVVIESDGSIAIHGYPRETFPPTDFHSATLVGNMIFIIGCLGYPEQRVVGSTPVFRLALDTMAITRVETSGESPGWVHRHSAELTEDGTAIVVRGGEIWLGKDRTTQENIDSWSLDVVSGRWTRLSRSDWQRWTMVRVDRKQNRLWDVRQERWRRDHASLGIDSYWRHADAPDFDALDALYRLDESTAPAEQGSEYNVYRAVIDGVSVKFTEDRWSIKALVEGRLSGARLGELQRATLATLRRLEASDWEIEPH
jgi:hypothetical protein